LVKVKICGITNLEDAQASIEAGCDGLGFVFYKKSRRYINPKKTKEILQKISPLVKKIGVFVNEKEVKIRNITEELKLDMLQFHGDESPDFCKRFKGYKVIKAFRIKDKSSLKSFKKYDAWGSLFDSYQKGIFGGTGKKFDWKIVKSLGVGRKNIFISGGLNTRNVKKVIQTLHPDWVDVSSSVEIRPGKKDIKKVKRFIKTVKDYRSKY